MVRNMSLPEELDFKNVKVEYTPRMIEAGIPPPEKWKGLALARTIGSKGYNFDTLLEDTKKMIGFEKWDGWGAYPTSKLSGVHDAYSLRDFALEHGDNNPLYTDPDYGRNSRYGCMLMYPTMHAPHLTHGVNDWGPYGISTLQGGYSWEYYDVIRVNSRLRTSVKMKECFEKKGRTGRLCFILTDVSCWNQRSQLVFTGVGTYIDVGKGEELGETALEASKKGEGMSKTMLYDRPTYHYSDDEVKKIVAGIESEELRGATPRYWEDVNVGDKLTPVVKGPITFMDFTGGGGEAAGVPFLPIIQSRPTKNPITRWSEATVMHHFDFNLCHMRGLPGPFDAGTQRVTMVAHPLCNWMGDDGFIRRVSMQIRKPNYYGDTQWFGGEVVRKYKDKVGEIEYGAVDIIISVINEVGENTLPSVATVYLPSRELGEVERPVPRPSEEEWKPITKRNVKDFINEFESGETILPPLPIYYGITTG
jgi:hypothetical protein